MTSVLVTGGTGQLGRRVVRALAADGHTVWILTRSPAAPPVPGAELLVADLSTGAGLRHGVAGTTAIVHCATDPAEVPDGRRGRNRAAAGGRLRHRPTARRPRLHRRHRPSPDGLLPVQAGRRGGDRAVRAPVDRPAHHPVPRLRAAAARPHDRAAGRTRAARVAGPADRRRRGRRATGRRRRRGPGGQAARPGRTGRVPHGRPRPGPHVRGTASTAGPRTPLAGAFAAALRAGANLVPGNRSGGRTWREFVAGRPQPAER
ncbi:NAD-dependent epimerase/dehydratase family protein [Geodermatophilus obscurus]|uniref:SDR family oxidoreductase n=1 Tax=Geodermatophilus obscurus TaxID=1861 RepID=UPI001140DF0D